MILGLDLGGANLKIASDAGWAKIIYAPLWRGAQLDQSLLEYSSQAEWVGVAITAELCDIFRSKSQGIVQLASQLGSIFGSKLRFFSLDLKFEELSRAISNPAKFCSTNWAAAASYLGREYPDCLYLDMGSTTTDLIPIKHGIPRAGPSDLERLIRGELIYMGALRTPIACLLPWIRLRSSRFKPAAEVFAIAGDAYLALGLISSQDYICDTPNWYSDPAKQRESCLNRLARLACCDLEELGAESALKIAAQFMQYQLRMLRSAIRAQLRNHELELVIGAGLGEFLISRAAQELDLDYLGVSELYGKPISICFPAFCLAKLLSLEQI